MSLKNLGERYKGITTKRYGVLFLLCWILSPNQTFAQTLEKLSVEIDLVSGLVSESIAISSPIDTVLHLKWVGLGESQISQVMINGQEVESTLAKVMTWDRQILGLSESQTLEITYHIAPSVGEFLVPLVLPNWKPIDAEEERLRVTISLPTDQEIVEIFPDEDMESIGGQTVLSSIVVPSMIKGKYANIGENPWTFMKMADLFVVSSLVLILGIVLHFKRKGQI